MALSAGAIVLLFCGPMALLHYADFVPTYGQRIGPPVLPSNTYLIPAVLSHSHALTPPSRSTNLRPAAHDTYSRAPKSNDARFKIMSRRKDRFTSSVNSWDAVLSRSQACDHSVNRTKGASTPLDWYHLLVSSPAVVAGGGRTPAAQRQSYTGTADLEASTNPSEVVESADNCKRRRAHATKVSQPADGRATPFRKVAHTAPPVDANPSVDPETLRESDSGYTHSSQSLLAHTARLTPRKRKRPQQTGVSDFARGWPRLTPAHAVEEFLHSPDDSDCRGETQPWDVSEDRRAFYRAHGEDIPEQTKGVKDEAREGGPVIEKSSHCDDTRGRDRQAAREQDKSPSQYPTTVEDNPGESEEDADSNCQDCPPRRNASHEGVQEQRSGSRHEAETQQIPQRQHQQRDHPEQQQLYSYVGGALRRRLATPSFQHAPNNAQQALHGLYGAQREVGSLLAAAEESVSVEPASRAEKQLQNKSKYAPPGRGKDSKVARSTRRTRLVADNATAGTESVSAAYHRYLQEEARALGYDPGKWEDDSFKDFAILGALALIGQPLWALSAMGFTVLDRLLHLDSVLEQHTVVHLRARRRLIRQFLKDAKKDQEKYKSMALSKAAEEDTVGHLRVVPTTYKFLSTQALNVLARFSRSWK